MVKSLTRHSLAAPNSDLSLEQARVEVLSRSIAMGAPNVIGAPAILKYALTSQQRYYFYRPADFIMDCIDFRGRNPTDYQLEIAEKLPEKKRIAARGPHSGGKTSLASWLVHWFALTRDGEDWKIPSTATSHNQLAKFLWPEIHKWSRSIRWDKIGRSRYTDHELLQQNLKLRTGEAFAVASNDVARMEGAHADYLLYLFDEAKAIPEPTFDGVEGAFAAEDIQEAYALAISTPGEPIGRFYDIHRKREGLEDWWTRHITLEETIAAGRVSRSWAEQKKRLWGENSALYQNRVLGNFYAGAEQSTIPLSWIEAAIERWKDWRDEGFNTFQFVNVSADIATGSGEDTTELAMRYGNGIKEIRTLPTADTMATAGNINAILRSRGGYAVIDCIGVGDGVLTRVREEDLNAIGFVASAKCDAKDKNNEFGFVNLRSAAWWNMREMLDPESGDDVMLPDDEELVQDLNAPHWREKSGGKIAVESKGETKDGGKGIIQRLGRSTNKGDAVVMGFCPKSWMGENEVIWIAV